MNYLSLNNPDIQDNIMVKEYHRIFKKYHNYFKDKNIDNIIRVRLIADKKTEVGTMSSQVESDLYADFEILKTQLPPREILDEMNGLQMQLRVVDAF